ncbi:hypothetical protein Tco_1226273 [Tanacetum coccineum]
MDYEKEMRSCKQPSTNDLKMPGETEVAKTQRLAKESAEEVQCACNSHLWKAYDTLCAFESSKDVPDNDTIVDEVDEMHTHSEINDSEVLQQIFLEYPFHRLQDRRGFITRMGQKSHPQGMKLGIECPYCRLEASYDDGEVVGHPSEVSRTLKPLMNRLLWLIIYSDKEIANDDLGYIQRSNLMMPHEDYENKPPFKKEGKEKRLQEEWEDGVTYKSLEPAVSLVDIHPVNSSADEEGGTTVLGCDQNDASIRKEMQKKETVKSVGAKRTTRSIRKDSSSQDSQSKENVSVLPQAIKCRLWHLKKTTIIAEGTVYKSDGKIMLHNKALPKDCYKVSIDKSLVDATFIPDVGSNGCTTVLDAVGGFVAWPKNQVVFYPSKGNTTKYHTNDH